MLVSCLCVCHNKPDIIPEAIRSLLDQTYPDWEALVVDSGVLYDAGYYDGLPWRRDRRIRLIRSHETAETRRTRAMAPWCFNECFRRGLVRGELVMYLCDDDVLYPRAFETFVAYCRSNPGARAMYASQDVGVIYPNGWHAIVGERRATTAGGRSCHGRRMDCEVDYLQFCHKTDVLKLFPDKEYWPEAPETAEHADGRFMERVGARVPIHPIDVKVSQNRRTARSTYIALPSFCLLDCLANRVPLLPARERENGPVADLSREDVPLVTVSIHARDAGAGLSAALAALAVQTYPHLEVLVIDDSPTDALTLADRFASPPPVGQPDAPARDFASRAGASGCPGSGLAADLRNGQLAAFESLRNRYPHSRLLCQEADAPAHEPALAEARGEYFLPMPADVLACPDMVERLAARMGANPRLSAVTCYQLILPDRAKNVPGYALFRTAELRAVGGYDARPGASGEDWSCFFRLVNSGRQVDILPEHLFWRGPGDADRSALERFFALDRALSEERVALWTAMAGQERRAEELARENEALRARLGLLRYRIADRLDALCKRLPFVRGALKRLIRFGAALARRRPEDGR